MSSGMCKTAASTNSLTVPDMKKCLMSMRNVRVFSVAWMSCNSFAKCSLDHRRCLLLSRCFPILFSANFESPQHALPPLHEHSGTM